MPPSLVGALDQGTTSTRFILYQIEDGNAALLTPIASHQMEHTQIFPQPGWCEHDPVEIVENALECMFSALSKVPGGATKEDVACIGITNQRETTVAWDANTGKPLHNAIVWLDTRTGDICDALEKKHDKEEKEQLRLKTGLPISTYFSGTKMRWLLENVPAVKAANESKTLRLGTIETWLVYSLSSDGNFVTDCTNASRTMLMDLKSLTWDTQLCDTLVGENFLTNNSLPSIVSCAEPSKFGIIKSGALAGVKITAAIGDQHAAALGQRCSVGEAKNTYGTGCFAMLHTGPIRPVVSKQGLLSTVAWRLGSDAECGYALEGSVAIAGAGVQWLRDNLQIIQSASEIETKANSVPNSGGVVFVPAFSGLFAPRWRPDARGVIVGLTQHSNSNHICRALLDAICFQTKDVLDAMNKDVATHEGKEDKESSIFLTSLAVDGGASANNLLMQTQADTLGVPVRRPGNVETTALGAALAAGVGAGLWNESAIFAKQVVDEQETVFLCNTDEGTRELEYDKWADAVERSLGLA